MISGDFEVPKTGWYERGENAYEYRGDDNAKIWDDLLTEDERSKIMKDYFRDIGVSEVYDRMYEDGWKYHDFVDYFVDNLCEGGFVEMMFDYEFVYLIKGECFAHPMEVERMPTCCGVESKVNNVYESGKVEYLCPVCGKVYFFADLSGTPLGGGLWVKKIEIKDE